MFSNWTLKDAAWGVVKGVLSVIPVAATIVGDWFIPPLRTKILETSFTQPSLAWAIIGMGVAAAGWLFFENAKANYRNAPTQVLQADCFAAVSTIVLLTGMGVWQTARAGSPAWGLALWWTVALADAYMSPYYALNNATQKPYVPPARSGS